MNIWTVILSADFLFTAIRVMTPILFAALACMVFTKGGIDAIGTEGIMLSCALAGPVGGYLTKSAVGGLLVAMATGVILSCIFGYFTLILDTNPVLAGIALNTLSGGLTIFVTYYLTGNKGSTQSLNNPVVPDVEIPVLKSIPVLGEILSGHSILTYVGLAVAAALWVFFWKSACGLRIRAVGENATAAGSVGLNIMKYKYIALVMAGCLAGIGGAYMSMSYVSFFSRDMIAGRGWIGMAAESMGQGTPLGILFSVLLFGMADSLAIRLQMLNLPSQLIQTIPYVVTIAAIAIYSRHRMQQGKKKIG
ncbi:MAG: ABC transporter permease [Clostridiales bacterium]|nr:ABC transporter permease [Clostridiales bacterium]